MHGNEDCVSAMHSQPSSCHSGRQPTWITVIIVSASAKEKLSRQMLPNALPKIRVVFPVNGQDARCSVQRASGGPFPVLLPLEWPGTGASCVNRTTRVSERVKKGEGEKSSASGRQLSNGPIAPRRETNKGHSLDSLPPHSWPITLYQIAALGCLVKHFKLLCWARSALFKVN